MSFQLSSCLRDDFDRWEPIETSVNSNEVFRIKNKNTEMKIPDKSIGRSGIGIGIVAINIDRRLKLAGVQ